jgi:putative RNA 2'-phosphotransferase
VTDQRKYDPAAVSRAISHALRHEPWLYELELDDEGWTSASALIFALNRANPHWALSRADLENVVAASDKRRHELVDERIRALYGHSLPGKLERRPATPPALLFHGTSSRAAIQIAHEGLRPMHRQYVHLSIDRETAEQVGSRKDQRPVIVTVDARAAHDAQVAFYAGNPQVWLVDMLPARFLTIPNSVR